MPSLVRSRPVPDADARRQGGPPHGTLAAVAVLVVILVGGVSVVLAGGDGAASGPAREVAPVGVAAGPTGPPDEPEPSPAGGAGVPPLLTEPTLTWQLFEGVPLPFSATAGPKTVDGPVYAGYERSPVGALVAATQLGTRYLLTPGDGWREVVDRQVLPGLGRDTFVRNRAAVDGQDPPGTYGQPAGFRVVTFSPDVAVIQQATRFAMTGTLQVTTSTVKWVNGDWRLELQPDGGSSATAQAVADLDGFVVWGP